MVLFDLYNIHMKVLIISNYIWEVWFLRTFSWKTVTQTTDYLENLWRVNYTSQLIVRYSSLSSLPLKLWKVQLRKRKIILGKQPKKYSPSAPWDTLKFIFELRQENMILVFYRTAFINVADNKGVYWEHYKNSPMKLSLCC